MSESDRPPLDPRIYEQIEMAMFQVERRHWPFIASMRVPRFIPLDQPIPPKLPNHLINQLQWFASMLLKAEADQYEQFRNDERYEDWLFKLTERILDRVLKTFDRIDQGKLDETLGHHEVTRLQIIFAVREIMHEITHPYTGGIARLPTQSELEQIESYPAPEPPSQEAPGDRQVSDRKALRDSYLAAFPDAKLRDICWAAQQHYREWRRWLNGEIKEGLKPDRAFRRVLTSGKSPEDLVKRPRPPKWE